MFVPCIIPRTAPADQSEIDMVAMIGQSQLQGNGNNAEGPGRFYFQNRYVEIPGAFIWDKLARSNSNDLSLVDSSRSNEAHEFKPLEMGYTGAATYPWDKTHNRDDNGPEMMLAHLWRQHTGRRLFIVKYAVGGSTLLDKGAPSFYWHPDGIGGGRSYLEIFLTAYWGPALTAALAEVGGDRQKIKFRGVVSCQGTSEAFSAAAAGAWESSMTDIINHVRPIIADTGEATQIPWLILQTPPTPPTREPAYSAACAPEDIWTIRSYQADTAASLANVDVRDTINCKSGVAAFMPHPPAPQTPIADTLHINTEGSNHMGAIIFRWMDGVTPYAGPHGES